MNYIEFFNLFVPLCRYYFGLDWAYLGSLWPHGNSLQILRSAWYPPCLKALFFWFAPFSFSM